MLPVQVSEDYLQHLISEIKADPNVKLRVDLKTQKISIKSSKRFENFTIDPYKKTCLINGYDDIDYLLSKKETIKAFEAQKTY